MEMVSDVIVLIFERGFSTGGGGGGGGRWRNMGAQHASLSDDDAPLTRGEFRRFRERQDREKECETNAKAAGFAGGLVLGAAGAAVAASLVISAPVTVPVLIVAAVGVTGGAATGALAGVGVADVAILFGACK